MASIIGTFGNANIISTPWTSDSAVLSPLSIEFDQNEVVAINQSPFTAQTQTYDWAMSYWRGTVSFPPMYRYSADQINSFIMALRGPINAFYLGDPRSAEPKGTPSGTPVVNSGGQTGYTVYTNGWTASTGNLLLSGDYIQIGVRLYRVTDTVNSDDTGTAAISIWPNLRDQPAANTSVITSNAQGLFRLSTTSNKTSVNAKDYGITALSIIEFI